MKHTETFKEAKRLHRLGFAIHWLHKKSKRPIESGWTTGPRKSWDYLTETYIEGLNVGVRLGTPSLIKGKYLAVVDVDIKSTDDRHRSEALFAAKGLLGGKLCPIVSSGRGNGSRHYYCLTDEPFKTFNPAQSKEIIKVHMPSKKASKKELAELTGEEIAAGIRLSHAWEISLYSDGRQVVLPPSIHPDSGEPYLWKKHLKDIESLPLIEFEIPIEEERENGPATERVKSESNHKPVMGFNFEACDVELAWLPISERVRNAIVSGEGVTDRSGYLLAASTALVSAGLNQNEILSVLTDRNTYLGQCAYEHAQTKDRARAAHWVYKYTVKRVESERDPVQAFASAPPVSPGRTLSSEEITAQNNDVTENEIKWTDYIERTDVKAGHKVKNTLHNVKLILSNVFGKDCVKTNEFANTEELWGDFPWAPRKGKEIYDIDVKMLKDWFVKKWSYEPSDDKLINALSILGFENRYHPVRQWIEALPRWDGKDRIDNLLETYIPCEGSAELRSVVGRRFMVALIKRIYEPGCQSDYLLVLEGLQGLSKSTAFRALIGDEWFSDASFNVYDKDAIMVIFSKWLIEFGELSVLDRATAEATKAFITRRVDRMRAPFDKKARDYPRQCLFVGSTNKEQYLKDDSGNRRYWPFRVISDCLIGLIQSDRDQLFAEAKYYYDIGELTYLAEPHLKELMLAQQESREMYDVLAEQVEGVISRYQKDNGKVLNDFQISFFFDHGKLHNVRNDLFGTARVGQILKKLGYESYREGAGERRRLWKSKMTASNCPNTDGRRWTDLTENEEYDFR